MFLKFLRTIALKNEFPARTLVKHNCNRFFTTGLQLRLYCLHCQTKFYLQDIGCNVQQAQLSKNFSTSNNQNEIEFEQVCNETLESLCEYFEEIIEKSPQFDNPDITFSDGVLTVQLGKPYGTYVINRQTPNKQIWLSSPKSGPKRYDFNKTQWIYKHDGVSLHKLLTAELSNIVSIDVNFSKCVFGGA